MVRDLEPVCRSRRGSGSGAEAGRAAPCACPPLAAKGLQQSMGSAGSCAAILAPKSCPGALTGGLGAGPQGAWGVPPWAGSSSGPFSLALDASSGAAASSAAPTLLAPLRDRSAPGSLVALGLHSSDSALSPGVDRSSAPSCLASLELPPLQDWSKLGSLHRPGPRPALPCEQAAAAHNWAAVAAARGRPGPGLAGSGPPCLSTRGSAPGALGGRQAPLLRGPATPPVQAYPRPERAQAPTHTYSSAPAGSCGVALAGHELAWAGGGATGSPYGMYGESAFAAPMAPSLTPAAALPGSIVSPFSAAAAFEMQGAFLGAARPRCDTAGWGASGADGGAGSGGGWPMPRPTAGVGPGAVAATVGSNASENTAAPLGPDLRNALAMLQARARHTCKRLLFRGRALRQSVRSWRAPPPRGLLGRAPSSSWLAATLRWARCCTVRRGMRSCLRLCARKPCLWPHLPGQSDARHRAQAPPDSPCDLFDMHFFPDFDAMDAAAADQRT